MSVNFWITKAVVIGLIIAFVVLINKKSSSVSNDMDIDKESDEAREKKKNAKEVKKIFSYLGATLCLLFLVFIMTTTFGK